MSEKVQNRILYIKVRLLLFQGIPTSMPYQASLRKQMVFIMLNQTIGETLLPDRLYIAFFVLYLYLIDALILYFLWTPAMYNPWNNLHLWTRVHLCNVEMNEQAMDSEVEIWCSFYTGPVSVSLQNFTFFDNLCSQCQHTCFQYCMAAEAFGTEFTHCLYLWDFCKSFGKYMTRW